MDVIAELKKLIGRVETESETAPEPVVEVAQAPPTPQPVQTPEPAPKPVAEAPAQEMDYAKQLADVQKALAEQSKEMAILAQRPTHAPATEPQQAKLPVWNDETGLRALYTKELADDEGQFVSLNWRNPDAWVIPGVRT